VGLKALSDQRITAGAHLFGASDPADAAHAVGHVTSVCYSPTLDVHLGLAFLENGRARHGETVRAVDHVRGVEVMCEVADPVFFDPEGGRMRG